jgi:hypothetical protein
MPKLTIPWNIILGTVVALALGQAWVRKPKYNPPTTWGKFIIGCGQELQKDPKGFLVHAQQAVMYGYCKDMAKRLGCAYSAAVYIIFALTYGPKSAILSNKSASKTSLYLISKNDLQR